MFKPQQSTFVSAAGRSLLFAALAVSISTAAAQSTVIYQNDFDNPSSFVTPTVWQDVNSPASFTAIYPPPAGVTIQQFGTPDVLQLGNTVYSDPSGIGDDYSLGLRKLVGRRPYTGGDMLSFTFDAGTANYINFGVHKSVAGLLNLGGTVEEYLNNSGRLRIFVLDTPGGVFDISTRVNGTSTYSLLAYENNFFPSSPYNVMDWIYSASVFDISGATDGNVTVVLYNPSDSSRPYIALDNVSIVASNQSTSWRDGEYGPLNPNPISINKNFSPAAISAGNTATLTINISGDNAGWVSGLAVTDTLPAPLVLTGNHSTTCSGGTLSGALNGNTLSLSGASIPPLGCSITAEVSWPLADWAACNGSSITNTISDFSYTQQVFLGGDGGGVNNSFPFPTASADLSCAFTPAPQLQLVKGVEEILNSNGDGVLGNLGDTVVYTFTVTNTGNVPISNITITDPLVTVNGGPISLNPAESDSSTFTAMYTITQTDLDNGTISNTATVEGEDPSGNPVSDDSDDGGDGNDPTVTPVPVPPGIELVKTASVADTNGDGIFGNVGDTINYTFTITNTGQVALGNITLTDANPNVTISGSLASLAVGAVDNTSFTGSYVVTQADVDNGSFSNTATVSGTDPANNTVSDTSDNGTPNQDTNNDGDDGNDPTVTPTPMMPAIELVKTASVADTNNDGVLGNLGDVITYNFTVTNTGNVTLTNISITDPNVTVNGTLASLAPNTADMTTFTASHTVTQADVNSGSISNQATVSGTDPANNPVSDVSDDGTPTQDTDNDGDDGNDPTVTPTPMNPAIQLVKTAGVTDTNGDGVVGNLGDVITYTFTVTNTGNTTLSNISITDPNVTVNGGPMLSLAPNASDSSLFTASHTITQADINAGSVTNTATVNAVDPQGNPVSDVSDNGSGTGSTPTVTPIPTTPPRVPVNVPTLGIFGLLLMTTLLTIFGRRRLRR